MIPMVVATFFIFFLLVLLGCFDVTTHVVSPAFGGI